MQTLDSVQTLYDYIKDSLFNPCFWVHIKYSCHHYNYFCVVPCTALNMANGCLLKI